MLSLLLLLLYLQSSLQVWNTNEDEDLQMLVIISRPLVKCMKSIMLYILLTAYLSVIMYFSYLHYFSSMKRTKVSRSGPII